MASNQRNKPRITSRLVHCPATVAVVMPYTKPKACCFQDGTRSRVLWNRAKMQDHQKCLGSIPLDPCQVFSTLKSLQAAVLTDKDLLNGI